MMENKKFEIRHQFKTYSVETLLSEVEPIENGGINPNTSGVSLETLVEFPLLEAAKAFKEKGIETIFSSANMKDVGGEVYITLDYDSLSETNRKVAAKFSDVGESHGSEVRKSVKIAIPANENMTIGDVIMEYREILDMFEYQRGF